MRERTIAALRWFVGLSLLVGGIALLAGALSLRDGAVAGTETFALVAVSVVAMLLVIAFEETPHWPWYAPALLPVLLLMTGIVWARYDDAGHLFLSGLAPFVAFLTGYGILRQRHWAWPVAFLSVAGVGPTLLLFVPLPSAAVGAAFVLFVLDALALLALAQSSFETTRLSA